MEKHPAPGEPASPVDDSDAPKSEHKPDPDALARDDLPEAERVEHQNDLA